MVRKAAFLIVLMLATAGHAREIKSISIDRSRESSDSFSEAIRQCKDFHPTRSQLRAYFAKAYPVDEHLSVNMHYSAYYAEGTIVLLDGNRGRWKLLSSGIAIITWQRGDSVVLFHTPNAWYDPFAGSYDDNGI